MKSTHATKFYFLILGLLVFIFSNSYISIAKAQTVNDPNATISAQIPEIQQQSSITLKPEIPKPNQEVNISVEAYGIDLDRSEISWSVNGTVVNHGTGLKSFTLNAGPVGKTTRVVATIKPTNGPSFSQTAVIAPADVDLIWESDSYTPPFYKGKSLYSYQNNVRVVALPTLLSAGSPVNRSRIIYQWKKNYTAFADHSGYGVNYFDVTGNILTKPDLVSVEVSSADNPEIKASQNINLVPGLPQLIAYEDNPLYGVLFNHGLNGTYSLNQSEVQVSAYPYFFGTTGRSNLDLSYSWSINGKSIDVPTDQNSVTFRQTAKEQGQSSIQATVDNGAKILQQAASSFAFVFGK